MPVSGKSSTAKLPASTVDQLLKSLFVLSRTTERVLEANAVATAVGKPMSSSRVQVLRLLAYRPGQTAGQVARFLGITKPAVTQIITALVRARLVRRRTAEHDRREVGLTLTPRGRQRFNTIRKRQRHLLRTAFRTGSESDLKAMITTLERLASSVALADDTFQAFCAQCGAHEDGTCVLQGGHASCPYADGIDRDG
ncbi:MAG: MarR family winged helix-turn-helix transcriptional regulator [Planctomycetota bacterium]